MDGASSSPSEPLDREAEFIESQASGNFLPESLDKYIQTIEDTDPLVAISLGLSETVASLGTGLAGAAAATIGGMKVAITEGDISAFPEVFHANTMAMTYEPRSDQGQAIMGMIGGALEYLAKVRKDIGNAAYDFMSTSPYASPASRDLAPLFATGLEVGLAAAPMVLGVGRLSRGRTDAVPKGDDTLAAAIAEAARGQIVETKGLPLDTVKMVERGHIRRAGRLMENEGLSYGDAINKVVSQTKDPAVWEHLTSKPSKLELKEGLDPRTFEQMKESLYEPVTADVAVLTAARMIYANSKSKISMTTALEQAQHSVKNLAGKDGTINAGVAPDINMFRRDISAMVAPAKFVGDLHPVLKWGTDRINTYTRQTEAVVNKILHEPELVEQRIGLARRKAVPKKTDKGAITIFEDQLTAREQIKLLADAERYDTAGIEPTRANFKEMEWSPKMVEAYQGLRRGTDQVLQENVKAAMYAGNPRATTTQPRAGYLPRVYRGDFTIFVRNSAGDLVKTFRANKLEAGSIAKDLRARHSDYSVSVVPHKRATPGDLPLDSFRETIRHLKGDNEAAGIIEKTYMGIIRKRGFGVHFKQRHEGNVSGYMGSEGGRAGVRNFIDGYKQYVEGGVRHSQNMRMNYDINRTLVDGDMLRAWPNALNALERFRNNASGKEAAIDRVIGDWTRNTLGESAVRRTLGGVNRVTLTTKLFMWNGRFMMAQGIQPFQVIPAKLANLKSQGMKGSIGKSIAQSMKDMVAPDAEAAAAIRYSVNNGTIAPKFVKELDDVLTGSKSAYRSGDVLGLLTGQRMAGRIEEHSRILANMQFYRFLRDSGVDQTAAQRWSSYLTDKYMVEYTSIERPLIYGSQGLGMAGKPIGLFKTFQHNYLAQAVEHVKHAKKGRPQGMAVFVGSNVLAAGLMGVIGREAADKMLSALGQPTLSELMLTNNIPDWVLWGVPSATIDMDLTTTLSAPDLMPSDILSVAGYEFVGKSVFRLGELLYEAKKGTKTDQHELRFWSAVSPPILKGLIEEQYKTPAGITPMLDVRGYGGLRRTEKDKFARYMSARSLRESRISQSVWQRSIINRNEKDEREAILNSAAWAYLNDVTIPDWQIDRASELGINTGEFFKSARLRAQKMDTELLERITENYRTKRGRKQAEIMERFEVLED